MRKVLVPVMEWLPAMGIVVTILVGWEIFVRVWNIADWLLPAPSAIGYTLYDSSGLLGTHVGNSRRSSIGICVGTCLRDASGFGNNTIQND